MEKFRILGIIEPILEAIREHHFEKPSEIQEKSIPLISEGRDVIAGAATGSGKTLAFASGIIKLAEKGEGTQALVLTPTRELAEQVTNVIQKFSKNKHLKATAIYGGVSINPQIESLRKAEIVVGTPGRILDHLQRRTINLRKIKILVLDEADRMLDMGFQKDVGRIIEQCNSHRQTLLFSATISKDISYLAKKYMNNPIEVSAESYVDPLKLKQIYYDIEDYKKLSLLVHLLKNENANLIMVFCNTQKNTDFVANNLNANNIPALAIHGGHSQEKRKSTMQKFSSQSCPVLVCTDVAARGLDIKGVSHIYNYEIPKDSKEYIHRIGRTARAGNEGRVINIVSSRDYENFQNIINREEFNIVKEENPETERIVVAIREQRGRGFGRGNNQSRFGGRSRGEHQSRFSGRSRFGGNRNNHNRSGGRERSERSSNRFGGNRNNRRGFSGGSRFGNKRY